MTTSSSVSSNLTDELLSYQQLVLDMKEVILDAYYQRCLVTEGECANLHLDACRSRLPSGECSQDDLFDNCAELDCGVVRDYENPTVRLPEAVATGDNLNPTDGDVIETMCFSVLLNSPLRDLYERASAVGSNAVYFGAWTGVFRYFPGAIQEECGSYDPRIRPWYVAASSGPKDVVIVVDVSGSMAQNDRLDLAKDAAITVVQTLGVDSYVNVVVFSEEARVLMNNTTTLVQANSTNLELLVDLIGELEIDLANVATNFGAAFETVFDLLDESHASTGVSSDCQTAIVFLTDGQRTVGQTAEETIAMIETRNTDIGAQVFSFSLGADADEATTKQIACDTGGIYEHVEDGGDLSQAMAFFYRFYAMGLGENEDFVAMTDIYDFATGGDLGFTIGTPVYDNSSDPPAFLGVTAIDFKVQTFMDEGFTVDELREAIVVNSQTCPSLSLTECQRQLFRSTISALSVCETADSNCSSEGTLEPERCMEESEYPVDLWENTDLDGYSFAERACCGSNFSADIIGTTCDALLYGDTDDSDSGSSNDAAHMGVGLAAGVLGAAILAVLAFYCRRKKQQDPEQYKEHVSANVAEAVGPPQNAPQEFEVQARQ